MTAKLTAIVLLVSLAICQVGFGQSTRPATTQATTNPDPQATALSAVEYVLKLTKAQDFSTIRSVILQQATVSEVQEQYAQLARAYEIGYTFKTVDCKQLAPVVSVICEADDKEGKKQSFFCIWVVDRFDEWKVEIGMPNLHRLSPGERDAMLTLEQWRQKRIAELRSGGQPGK